jgi:hypothetical protein
MKWAAPTAVAIVFGLLATTAAVPGAERQLACVLTDTEAKPRSETRPLVITFDQDKRMLIAKEGERIYQFTKVSISNVSISGHAEADNISLGIDRSSMGIVWQQYGTDKVRNEYGHCQALQERE